MNFSICTHACVTNAAASEKKAEQCYLRALPPLALSLCRGIRGGIHRAHSTLLQSLDWPDSCERTTTTHTHCQRALTRRRCGNGKNNELLQGYLCVSPCHDCVSGSANLIRWDKLLKMFSDFLSLLLLCPQIDFRSVC